MAYLFDCLKMGRKATRQRRFISLRPWLFIAL